MLNRVQGETRHDILEIRSCEKTLLHFAEEFGCNIKQIILTCVSQVY